VRERPHLAQKGPALGLLDRYAAVARIGSCRRLGSARRSVLALDQSGSRSRPRREPVRRFTLRNGRPRATATGHGPRATGGQENNSVTRERIILFISASPQLIRERASEAETLLPRLSADGARTGPTGCTSNPLPFTDQCFHPVHVTSAHENDGTAAGLAGRSLRHASRGSITARSACSRLPHQAPEVFFKSSPIPSPAPAVAATNLI
jgi:hypothetical protein